LLGAVVLITFVSYLFIGSANIVAYLITVAAIAIIALAVQLFMTWKKRDLLLLISFIDKDPKPDANMIRDMHREVGGNPENIAFLGAGCSLMLIKNEPRDKSKKLQKELEVFFQKKTVRFGLVQYFHIVVALILIASIWRF